MNLTNLTLGDFLECVQRQPTKNNVDCNMCLVREVCITLLNQKEVEDKLNVLEKYYINIMERLGEIEEQLESR